MQPDEEQAKRWKLNEILRWICVLPAAVFGGILAEYLIAVVFQFARYGGELSVGDSNIAHWLMVFLRYVPRRLGFVVAGAITSPRYQRATAVGLGVLGVLMSLTVHVVGQHLVGNRVGLINYVHFAAETAGGVAGVAWIFVWNRRSRPRNTVG